MTRISLSPGGLRPIDDSPRDDSVNFSMVARKPVAPNEQTDVKEPFNRVNGCVILGYTKQDGKTTDHNLAMTYANRYWKAEKDSQRKKNKNQSPTLRVLPVNSKEELLAALEICPKGGEINIDTHGFSENGGGFCVGPDACVDATDVAFMDKLNKTIAAREPKAIWINACEVAGSMKDSKLGNDNKISASFLNKLANGVFEEMSATAIAAAGTSGKSKLPKPVRVHGFTTVVNSSETQGPVSSRRDTDRVTFEADPEVQERAKMPVKPGSLFFGNTAVQLPANFDPKLVLPTEPAAQPGINPSDLELMRKLRDHWSTR